MRDVHVDGDYFCIVDLVLWIVARGRRRRVIGCGSVCRPCVSTDGEKLHAGGFACGALWDPHVACCEQGVEPRNPYLNRIRCPRFEASGVGIRRVREIGKIDL